jgi:methylglyoxal reductase
MIIVVDKMKLGKTQIDISKIGLGTWAIGGGPAWGGDKDLQECIDTIRECPKLGVNLIDTAPGYNFGNSEKIVGQALSGMKRKDVVLITKCGIVWTREGSLFNKVGDIQLYKNLSKESVREEFELSLERLGTDYVDVYMTHWQSVEPFFTPISETMEVLNELKAEGKIRAIGAANASPEHIKEYLKYGELDIVQGKYSILDRKIENDLLPICKEYGITLQAYSPLEQGLLSGSMGRDYVPVGAQIGKRWFERDNMINAINMMEDWKGFCKKYDCTVANLALAWILAQGDFINLLSGATTTQQIEQNVKSAEIKLSKEDVRMMREMAVAIDR